MADEINPSDWMQGFPPAEDRIVRFADGSASTFPRTRWSFNHYRELAPTKTVKRAATPRVLPRADSESPLDALPITTMTGESSTVGAALASVHTDGFLVMHKGRVVYERYFGEAAADRPHIIMSVTKSFVGTLAQILVTEGRLDETAPVSHYLPEMAGTAYDGATVRDVMDMRIGVRYSENYADPNAEVFDYARAGGMMPRPPGYAGPDTIYAFLQALKGEGPHGQAFAYKTVNTEVLAWIVKRVSGRSLTQLVSERLWSRIGTEEDAYFQIDPSGTEAGGGGLNATLRDLARFGELMLNEGTLNGERIIPAAVVADIAGGSDPAAFAPAGYDTLKGWSYRNMWWVSNYGAYMARGIYGQAIYVDPNAAMVIVRLGSHTIAANTATDPVMLPTYQAIAAHLIASGS